MNDQNNACALCGRTVRLFFHHLIPKKCHSNKWFKKKFTQDDMRTRGIDICSHCHRFIHKHFSEKELGRNHNTKEILLEIPKIQDFIHWVKKQK